MCWLTMKDHARIFRSLSHFPSVHNVLRLQVTRYKKNPHHPAPYQGSFRTQHTQKVSQANTQPSCIHWTRQPWKCHPPLARRTQKTFLDSRPQQSLTLQKGSTLLSVKSTPLLKHSKHEDIQSDTPCPLGRPINTPLHQAPEHAVISPVSGPLSAASGRT